MTTQWTTRVATFLRIPKLDEELCSITPSQRSAVLKLCAGNATKCRRLSTHPKMSRYCNWPRQSRAKTMYPSPTSSGFSYFQPVIPSLSCDSSLLYQYGRGFREMLSMISCWLHSWSPLTKNLRLLLHCRPVLSPKALRMSR